MSQPLGDGNAAIAEVRADVRGLRREADSQSVRLAKIEEAVQRMYNVPDQIKELGDTIKDLDRKFDTRGETSSQNARGNFWTVLGFAMTIIVVLATELFNLITQGRH